MAKKSIIERNNKRKKMADKYAAKRLKYKNIINSDNVTAQEKFFCMQKLAKLPRNSSRIRVCSRCMVTGRSRSVYRDFGLSRHMLRMFSSQGLLPGVTKSSW